MFVEQKLRRFHNVRSVERPAASGDRFPLSYVRTGTSNCPIVLVPGGPGLASVTVYPALRRWAAAHDLDVLMVEHRGVGLSRRTTDGADLTAADMHLAEVVDDIAAVLDAEGVATAHLFGSSYGSYVVQAFAATHPERVADLVLDSPILSTEDYREVRATQRRILLDGHDSRAATAAALVRRALDEQWFPQLEITNFARIVYEFCGPADLERLLRAAEVGAAAPAWRQLRDLSRGDTERLIPYVMEFDLVGSIAFGELNFAPDPDGLPFDPGAVFAEAAQRFAPFVGEPFDLPAALARAPFPVAVISGERDLRTPPSVARRAAALAPHGTLVPVADAGHSLLDTNAAGIRLVLPALQHHGAAALTQLAGPLSRAAAHPGTVFPASLIRTGLAASDAYAAVRRRLPRVSRGRPAK